jgi:hypothetical protein
LAPLLDIPEAPRLLFHAAAGRLHWTGEPAVAATRADRFASAGFDRVASRGCDTLPGLAPQVALLALRQRIRLSLDPRGVMAFGETWQRGSR